MARIRSRNYPGLGLRDSIAKARDLYNGNGKAAVAKDVAVKSWGYNGLNGASLRVLGALNQYGLLDIPESKTVRLSPRALAILLEPDDSQERANAIIEAARTPPVFQEVLDHYPDGLPSDDGLKSYLVRSLNFRDDAASNLIASLRDALDLAESARKMNTSSHGAQNQKQKGSDQSTSRQGSGVTPQGQTFAYSLPEGVVANVTITGKPVTQQGVKVLRDFLDLVKQSIEVATAENPPPA